MASTPSLDDLRIDRSDNRDRARRWPWVVAVCLLALGGGGWWWWTGPAQTAEVRTGTAREATGSIEETILNASGYVTARRRATVSSKVTGKLVEEGMAVRKGQVLARLDDATVRSRLALAEAQLKVAQRGFAEQEVRLREAELTLGRTREIATLRALGFAGSSVVVSVLVESAMLAIFGGVLGGGVAYAAFHGYQTATMNWQTFSQVAIAFTVTPALLIQGAAYALVMGLFGGLFPAIRAARLPIVTALREL